MTFALQLDGDRLDHTLFDCANWVDPLCELAQYLLVAKSGGLGCHVAAVLYGVERAAGPALRCVGAAGAPAVEGALEARVSLDRLGWGDPV